MAKTVTFKGKTFKTDTGNFFKAKPIKFTEPMSANVLRVVSYNEEILIDTVVDTVIKEAATISSPGTPLTAEALQDLIVPDLFFLTKGGTTQTVTSSLNPATLPGLLAWYDVTDAASVTSVTGAASQVNDKSGNARHLLQATAGSRPLYKIIGGPNNKAYLNQNGRYMQAGSAYGITGEHTIYVMQRQNSYTTGNLILATRTNAGFWGFKQLDQAGSQNLSAYAGVGHTPSSKYAFRTQYSLLKGVFDGPSSLKVTINDEPLPYDQIRTTPAPGSIVLDYIIPHLADWHWSEMIIIGGAVSAANDTEIKNYFKAKYATTDSPFMIFLGDSHTAGLGSTAGNSYVRLTETERLIPAYNNGLSGTVVWPNGSFNGLTTYNLSDIYTNWLTAPKRAYVIFQYGTNDGTNVALAQWKTNYKAYIQAYKDAGFDKNKIIICSPPYNTNATYATNLANAYPVIQAIASELGIRLADFRAAHIAAGQDVNTVPSGDLIHMGDAMHRTAADTLKLQIQG